MHLSCSIAHRCVPSLLPTAHGQASLRGWGSGSPRKDPEGRLHPQSRSCIRTGWPQSPISCSLRCRPREEKAWISHPPSPSQGSVEPACFWGVEPPAETWTLVLETMPGPRPRLLPQRPTWLRFGPITQHLQSRQRGMKKGGGMFTREAPSPPDAVD